MKIWFDPGGVFTKMFGPAPGQQPAQQQQQSSDNGQAARDAANTEALKEKNDAIKRAGSRQTLLTDADTGTTFGSNTSARKTLLGANA